jgi:hypothetical protein
MIDVAADSCLCCTEKALTSPSIVCVGHRDSRREVVAERVVSVEGVSARLLHCLCESVAPKGAGGNLCMCPQKVGEIHVPPLLAHDIMIMGLFHTCPPFSH